MKKKIDLRPYQFQDELDRLKADMAFAMQNAHVEYTSRGKLTPRILDTLDQFYDWAGRYKAYLNETEK